MKIRCFYNHWLPRLLKADGTTLYPFIFFAGSYADEVSNRILNHEYVHILQVQKLGWIRFYASYLWQYVRNRASGMSAWEAYMFISYEHEAYTKQATQEIPADFGK